MRPGRLSRLRRVRPAPLRPYSMPLCGAPGPCHRREGAAALRSDHIACLIAGMSASMAALRAPSVLSSRRLKPAPGASLPGASV
jgi:hypothetical protein